MTNNKSAELIELLENVLLQGGQFADNKSLQNLLLLTASKICHDRLTDYIKRLDNYDWKDVGPILVSQGRYEDAVALYRKFKDDSSVVKVLMEDIGDQYRALQFARECGNADLEQLVLSKQN